MLWEQVGADITTMEGVSRVRGGSCWAWVRGAFSEALQFRQGEPLVCQALALVLVCIHYYVHTYIHHTHTGRLAAHASARRGTVLESSAGGSLAR